jgi:hypothetical protein
MNELGFKIVLPRGGPDEFWQQVHDHYAGASPLKWKYLAMLALRENAGWPLDCIGLAFGHPKGHVSRCLQQVSDELRRNFQPPPPPRGFHDPDDDGHD